MNEATQEVALEEERQSQGKRSYVAKAYAAGSPTSGLTSATILRREPGPEDVQIEILYCGVCHSDLHQVRNEWQSVMPTVYPCVPGHEIVGRCSIYLLQKVCKCGAEAACPDTDPKNLRQLWKRTASNSPQT